MKQNQNSGRYFTINCTVLAALVTSVVASARADTYAMVIYESPPSIAARTDPMKSLDYWESFSRFAKTMQEAGILRGGSALFTGDRVQTVSVASGVRLVALGSPAKTGMEFGGYFVIEVPTVEEAIAWAARAPSAATGAVALHPYYPAPGMK